MGCAHVQAKMFSAGGGTVNNIPVTLDATVGSGNCIIGVLSYFSGTEADLTSITDDKSNTYTIVNIGNASSHCLTLFYLKNITNAPITITANLGAARDYRGITVREISGADTSAPLWDWHYILAAGDTGTTADYCQNMENPLSTPYDGSYLAMMGFDVTGPVASALTVGTGMSNFVDNSNASNLYMWSEHYIQANAGSKMMTATRVNTDTFYWYEVVIIPTKYDTGNMVQSGIASQNEGSASGTTYAITLGQTVQSGSAIIGLVRNDSNTDALSSVTDDKGNTYTIQRRINGSYCYFYSFYCLNITNGPKTFTANYSTSQGGRGIAVREVKNLLSSAALDVETGQYQTPSPGTGTDAVTSGSVSPTVDNEYIIAMGGDGIHTARREMNFTKGTGYSKFDQCGHYSSFSTNHCTYSLWVEELKQGTKASVAGTATQVNSDVSVAFVMAFKTVDTTPSINLVFTQDANKRSVLTRGW